VDTVAQYVMSQVFAAINHRLSEEYTKIELQSQEAKDRCVKLAKVSMNVPYLMIPFSEKDDGGCSVPAAETLGAKECWRSDQYARDSRG
jgi:hypothetical protein